MGKLHHHQDAKARLRRALDLHAQHAAPPPASIVKPKRVEPLRRALRLYARHERAGVKVDTDRRADLPQRRESRPAGRPRARRVSRSTTRSGDSGDGSEPGEPPGGELFPTAPEGAS